MSARGLAILLGALAVAVGASAQRSERFRAMNQPVEPFHMLGNLYYVGANSVAAYLIVTPEGHVLIDGGFEETVPIIRRGVERLGFRLEDVALLLNSHAHFDHAGGLARLKELTGAPLAASALDAPVLEGGGVGDDLLGDEGRFPPVVVDRRLQDGDTVTVGDVTLTAHVTAGHTRGCTSWAFGVRDGDAERLAVSICSLSVLEGMRFVGEETYPGIGADFERSFERLRSLPTEVFLASHAGFFRMEEKRAAPAAAGPSPFVDRAGYLEYIDRAEARYLEALAAQSRETAP